MNPARVVDILLEGLPGPNSAKMDEIMDVIRSTIRQVQQEISPHYAWPRRKGKDDQDPSKPLLPGTDRDSEAAARRFVFLVNPLLEKYRLKFEDKPNARLSLNPRNGGNAGYVGTEGIAVIAPPTCLPVADRLDQIQSIISHELVHVAQHQSAEQSGKHKEFLANRRKINKSTEYFARPHETSAFARQDVERQRYRARGFSKEDTKGKLRQGWLDRFPPEFKQKYPDAYRRYMRHAYGYMQDIPDSMTAALIVNTLLETIPKQ